MMKNKFIAVLVIVTIVLNISGCWNRRDPENLALVLGMAFDMDPATGMYQVIAQIANPLALGGQDSGQGGGAQKKPFWTLSASGRIVFEAMRNLTEASSREFFWAHNRIFVFSEEVAKSGIYPIMDAVDRVRHLRTSSHVTITDGDVKKLMEAEFPLEETGAKGLDRQIVTIRYERSIFPVITINELHNELAQPGREMFIGKFEVPKSSEQESGHDSKTSAPPPAIIGGGAMFKGDKMVGWAGEKETFGWACATGRVFRAPIYIKDPLDDTTPIGIEINQLQSRMLPVIDDEQTGIRVEINAGATLSDIPVHRDLKLESSYMKSLEQRAAQEIRDAVNCAIDLSRELESDIIGFGNLIYRKQPKIWESIEDKWYDIFEEIEIDVRVQVSIRRTGLMTSPLESEKRR